MQNKKFFIQKFVSSQRVKNNFIFIMFIFFFTLSFSIILKRHFEPKSPPSALTSIIAATDFSLKNKKSVNQSNAFNIISNVLQKGCPLSTLKTFLKTIPDPWAAPLLSSIKTLNNIEFIQTFAQLDSLFMYTYYDEIDVYIKESVKTEEDLLSIIERTGKYSLPVEKKNILKALQNRNVERALMYFEKLSNTDKLSLSSWEKAARERLKVETIFKNILLEFCKEDTL